MRNLAKKNSANLSYYHRNKERILIKLKEQKFLEKKTNKVRNSLYDRWKNMMSRCNNQEDKDFKNYGARGIKVIYPLSDFKEYKEYILSIVFEPEDIFEAHIDRINNDGNYEIGNLRVISVIENLKNRRNTKNNPFLKGVKMDPKKPCGC